MSVLWSFYLHSSNNELSQRKLSILYFAMSTYDLYHDINSVMMAWLGFMWRIAFWIGLQNRGGASTAKLLAAKADLGPVVQSIVSLTSSLRGQLVKWLSVLQLYNQIHWNFLLKKWEKLLHCKSFSHFFNKKYWQIWDIYIWNFNETLTNDVASF